MGSLPRAKINDYYEQFKPVNVTFTKEVINVTGLLTEMVNLKCTSDFFPCVIYSTSFEGAQVVANNKSGIFERLRITNNALSIRFCFKIPATDEQIAFLVPAHFTSSALYGGSQDMSLFNLQFSQRPPDDLIEIMGRVLEANYYYTKCKNKLFAVGPDAYRKMRFINKDVLIAVGNATYGCLLREFAFGSMRFILKGAPQEILNKPAKIRLSFDEPQETLILDGSIAKFEAVINHPDVSVVTLALSDPVPLPYKARLCDYVTTLRLLTSKLSPDDEYTQPEEEASGIEPETTEEDTGAEGAAAEESADKLAT
ncbi:MAG: pilus assembly protein PilZ [Spirochaetaceae bacterium]|jgi:hypothetical protein|nr:pilus assembly protein PilZ [Spirochaetaceae bacterium]